MKTLLSFLLLTLTYIISFSAHGQWQSFGGPRAIDISDIHSSSTGDFYATSWVNGLYELKSGEKIWTQISDQQLLTHITTGDTHYYAGQEDDTFSGRNLLRSSDKGQTWVTTNFPRSGITDMILFNDIIYVSTSDDGLYTSDDNGVTWDLDATLESRQLVVFDNELYLAAESGVYKLESGTWTKLSDLLANISALGVSASKIYAASFSEIYELTLTADVWTDQNIGTVEGSVTDVFHLNDVWYLFGSGGLYKNEGSGLEEIAGTLGNRTINAAALSGSQFLLATSTGAFSSEDTGSTWESLNDGFPYTEISELLPLGDSLLAATRHGVFVSKNEGLDWTPMSEGLNVFRYSSPPREGIHTFSFGVFNNELFLGAHGAFRFNVAELKWEKLSETIPNSDRILAFEAHNDYLFIAEELRNVYRFKDEVVTKVNIGLPEVSFPRAFMPSDTGIFLAAYGLYFSKNNGDEWTEITGKDENIYSSILPGPDRTVILGSYGMVESHDFEAGKTETIYTSSNSDDDGWFRDLAKIGDTYLVINEYMDFYLSDDLEEWFRFNAGFEPFSGSSNQGGYRSSVLYGDYFYTPATNNGLIRRPAAEFIIKDGTSINGTYENSESILLSWENPDEDVFNIKRVSGVLETIIENVSGNSYEDTDANAGTEYTYQLVFESGIAGDHRKDGSILTIYLPVAPTLNDAQDVEPESFTLSWETEEPYTSYQVDVFESASPDTKLENYNALIVEGKSILIEGLSEKTTYGVQVKGVTDVGSGSFAVNENYVETTEVPAPVLGFESTEEIHVYPNPTKGIIRFSDSVFPDNSKINLTDTSGRLIFSVSGQNMPEIERKLSEKLSAVKSGTYLLQFNANGRKHSWKIIMQ